jgi:hypothetical protein
VPVTEAILLDLSAFYLELSRTGHWEAWIVKQKRALKILVDSLWEQIELNVLGKEPRNALEARKVLIEADRSGRSAHDIHVLDSLLEVLREYDVLISTSYIDIGSRLTPFVKGALKDLCVELSSHPDLNGSAAAAELARVLGKA